MVITGHDATNDMLYIKKELIQNRLQDSNGNYIQWDHEVDDTGVLAIDDSQESKRALAGEMNKRAGRLGLVVITQAEYDEFKKKPHTPIRTKPLDHMGGHKTQRQNLGLPSRAGVAGDNAAVRGLTQKLDPVPTKGPGLSVVADKMFSPRMAEVPVVVEVPLGTSGALPGGSFLSATG